MGRTYHFECPRCQYRARISGGADAGVNCRVQTILCRDCRELFDVFKRVRKRNSDLASSKRPAKLFSERVSIPPMMLVQHVYRDFYQTRPQISSPPLTYWEEMKLACPYFVHHHIEPWNDPGRCPRCRNFMEKNGFPFRLWD